MNSKIQFRPKSLTAQLIDKANSLTYSPVIAKFSAPGKTSTDLKISESGASNSQTGKVYQAYMTKGDNTIDDNRIIEHLLNRFPLLDQKKKVL